MTSVGDVHSRASINKHILKISAGNIIQLNGGRPGALTFSFYTDPCFETGEFQTVHSSAIKFAFSNRPLSIRNEALPTRYQ